MAVEPTPHKVAAVVTLVVVEGVVPVPFKEAFNHRPLVLVTIGELHFTCTLDARVWFAFLKPTIKLSQATKLINKLNLTIATKLVLPKLTNVLFKTRTFSVVAVVVPVSPHEFSEAFHFLLVFFAEVSFVYYNYITGSLLLISHTGQLVLVEVAVY